MNIRELKEIIKDLPDDMEVKIYDGYWNEYIGTFDAKVKEDKGGDYLIVI